MRLNRVIVQLTDEQLERLRSERSSPRGLSAAVRNALDERWRILDALDAAPSDAAFSQAIAWLKAVLRR